MKKVVLVVLLAASAAVGQITYPPSGGGPCDVSGSPTIGYVLTSLGGRACDWETVGGASVDANTVKNAWAMTDGGVANAITGSTTTAFPGSYAVRQAIIVLMSNTNTGPTTINVTTRGVVNVTKNGATALAAGNLVSGRPYLMMYDGTEFVVLNPTLIDADIPGTLTNKTVDGVTPTVFGYVDPTSSIQTQLNAKQASLGFTAENSANKGVASGYASLDGAVKVPIAQIPTGSTSSTVPLGNDSRLSDSRTPLAHATSHKNGGSDTVATATPGANAIPQAGSGGTLAGGWLPFPGASSLGAILSTLCTGGQVADGYNTDGTPHCVAGGGGGGTNSNFTGCGGVATSFSATPTFSLADLSGPKSPCRIEFGQLSNDVTSVTFSNKPAGGGSKFSIVWKQATGTHYGVTYGASASNTCDVISLEDAESMTQQFELAADGTSVIGAGCTTDGSSIVWKGPTGTNCTGATPSGKLCISWDSTYKTLISKDENGRLSKLVAVPTVAIDNEGVLFSGTDGQTFKRAIGSGVVHRTSGVDAPSAIVNADIASNTIDLTTKVTGALPTGNMATASLIRPCEFHIWGTGTAGVLQDTDDELASCVNAYGVTLTVLSVKCRADATGGSGPTITPIITGGSGLLTGALSCGNGSFATGTLSGTPTLTSNGSIDINITTAGGTATHITVVIAFTL